MCDGDQAFASSAASTSNPRLPGGWNSKDQNIPTVGSLTIKTRSDLDFQCHLRVSVSGFNAT